MNIRNKYWIISLSVLLSFSLVLPFCCHADVSELFAHQQEMQPHADHGQHEDTTPECNCGHELVKDYQKSKKSVGNQSLLEFPAILAFRGSQSKLTKDQPTIIASLPPGVLDGSGPALHLLISVFLN